MSVYNENRENNKNMHDEIREQNAKLKGAPFKEKLSYFKEYYLKATLAILAGLICIVALIYSIVSGPEDTAFAALFYNSYGNSSDTPLADNFAAYMEIDTDVHDVYIDTTMTYRETSANTVTGTDATAENTVSNETATAVEDATQEATTSAVDVTTALSDSMYSYEGYVGLEKTMALIASKELDVIVGDEVAFNYFCRAECFADLRTILTPEQLETYKDLLYYHEDKETGESIPYGIYVTDSPKLQEFHYYDGLEPIWGVIVNSQNQDNALAFLEYINLENE